MTEVVATNIHAAMAATAGQSEAVQAAAVQGAASAPVPPPPAKALDFVWRALVVGLLIVLVLALAGTIWVIQDGSDNTSPDVLITVFTTSLAGLLGLFVKSPT